MPPPGIEPGLQVPETCVISFSPRGHEVLPMPDKPRYHTRPSWSTQGKNPIVVSRCMEIH